MKSGVSLSAATGWYHGRDVLERCLAGRQTCRLLHVEDVVTWIFLKHSVDAHIDSMYRHIGCDGDRRQLC